jgi:hypothetical protein
MSRFEHKKILQKLISLDELPNDQEELRSWIKADDHIKFLIENGRSQEIVIYASPEYSFIHSMVVPEDQLESLDKNDLMGWSNNPFTTVASYVSGGGREELWVERGESDRGSRILSQSTNLIYGRTFEGWNGEDRDYFELLQEYAHLEGLHWRPEQRGYCKFDDNGDLDSIVSITKHDSEGNISLVTFDRTSLESYLAASNQVLVRLFDFTLLNRSTFSMWGEQEEKMLDDSDELFYKQKISGLAAYTRGVQIIGLSRPKSDIFSNIQAGWFGTKEKNHVEFIAYDFRNGHICKISTDPKATTNYFQAQSNNLPFELSPAFFKPEVLLKYKADKDKYTVDEREIHCRASWFLEAFDVNEAGQVFAYIVYLRRLPESELLHWLSYNEEPKTSISQRAFINDFQGEFVSFIDPLEKIKHLARTWSRKKYPWWCLLDDRLIDNVTVPITSSRDEWSDSFLTLTQLINEGFVVKVIRENLRTKQIEFDKLERSLSLLEKLINFNNSSTDEVLGLTGLRTAQLIRNKTKGHSAKKDAEELALGALNEHETYATHFRHVCDQIYDELEIIQNHFDSSVSQ